MDAIDALDALDGLDGYAGYGRPYAASALAGNLIGNMISLVWAVIFVIGLWKLFTKAGKPGWHAIIPFLNLYDLFTISWRRKKGVACIVMTAIAFVCLFIGGAIFGVGAGLAIVGGAKYYDGSVGPGLLSLGGGAAVAAIILIIAGVVLTIIAAIYEIIAIVKLGKAFGKEGGFGVGLFFLPGIFMLILGFGDARYVGSDEMRENGVYQNPNVNTNANANISGYCQNCGEPYQAGTIYCAKCGRQIR